MEINLIEAVDEVYRRKIKQYPHPSNRASEAGHPCVRFLVLSRLHPELKELHDVSLQRIFEEGNLHEEAVLQKLREAGFTLIEQQRPLELRKFQLSGHIDAKIRIEQNGKPLFIPLEIKSCSPNVFRTIKDISPEEMLKSKYPWIRKYPAQILLYMLMDGKEEGVIVFKNKSTGELCQKNFRLTDENLEYTESILQKLEKVNDYVARNELPPVEPCEECKRCGFARTSCFPDKDFGEGFDLLSNEELEAKLARWEELRPTAKEFQELDKEIKEELKGKNTIIGDWKIETKEYQRTHYNIPDEIKKKYVEKKPYFVVKIERIGK